MDFVDQTLVCSDCGQEFIHTIDDQQRYADKGFTHLPKRCRTCREKRRNDKAQAVEDSGPQKTSR